MPVEEEREYHLTYMPFEEVLQMADFISVHTPYMPSTHHLISERELNLMKPGAILINTARGPIVDEKALARALQAGTIAGAGLDVVTPAPLPAAHPLWDLPNVLITSHSGGLSTAAMRESQTTAMEDALAVLNGRQPAHPVPEMAAALGSAPRP